jgi:hypothetical protein
MFRFPSNGIATFKVQYSSELEAASCQDWMYEIWPLRLAEKLTTYPCSANAVPEAPARRAGSASSSTQAAGTNPGPTAALPPGSSGGAGQITKVQFVNESSGPIRLQITGNSEIGVGGQRWATIQPGKSEEIPVMSGQQKLRVEKVRTAGPVLLWSGFRREKTVEIAPEKAVQIKDDDFK